MSIIIGPEDIRHEDFTQASIYLDACFILAMLDQNDRRGDIVTELLDSWKDKDVSIGISTHTYAEVLSWLFKFVIIQSLEVYEQKKDDIRQHGIECLSLDEKIRLVNPESAAFLYRNIRQNKLRVSRKRKGFLNIPNLIKRAKQDANNRDKLHPYYRRTLVIYHDGFVNTLEREFNLNIKLVETDEMVYLASQQYIRLFQLEPSDAVHLAVANVNHFTHFATLDADFIHSYYDQDHSFKTKVIKIA